MNSWQKRCRSLYVSGHSRLAFELLESRVALTGSPVSDTCPYSDTCMGATADPYPSAAVVGPVHSDLTIAPSGYAYYYDSPYTDMAAADSDAAGSDATDSDAADPVAADPVAADGDVAELPAEREQGEKHPLTALPQLNSLPGAPNQFFIDLDGAVVTNTRWNADNDGAPIHAAPFDLDGDTTTFTDEELAQIVEIWQRVSEDFLPFNINVTTVAPSDLLLSQSRGAQQAIVSTTIDDPLQGGHGQVWVDNEVGGVAIIDSWISGNTPAWIFQDMIPPTAKAIAETVSHELGHTVGLSHDGQGTDPYYRGHGEGEMSWAPIMGAAYYKNVTQWSKGEYDGATNTIQDDLARITHRANKIDYREDDHGAVVSEASPVVRSGSRIHASGMITQARDYDLFFFDHEGGPIDLLVSPAVVGPNLDVEAELLDATERQVAFSAPSESLASTFQMDLPAGRYYLVINGGGFVPAEGEGYSAYGSLGQYTISGHLGEPDLFAHPGGPYTIAEGATLQLDGTLSEGPGTPLEFAWDVDGDGNFSDATGPLPKLTWNQLSQLGRPIDDDGVYPLALRVTDAAGNFQDSATLVTVLNVAPSAEIVVPETIFAGIPVQFQALAADVRLDPLQFVWTVNGTATQATDSVLVYTFTEPGSFTIQVEVHDDDGAHAIAQRSVQVLPDFPRVIESSFEPGQVLRSPQTLRFAFSHDVAASLNPTDLLLFNTTTNLLVNVSAPRVDWNAAALEATFHVGDIPAGSYNAVLVGDGILDAKGQRLDGDSDGDAGGSWTREFVVAPFADVNLDLAVNFEDFLILSANFGREGGRNAGDLTGDGFVDFADFLILSAGYAT